MVNSAVVVFTPASTTHRSWKSTSASVPGRYVWGTNPCFQRPTRLRRDLRATFPNVVAHRRIRQAVRVMLIDQTCQNLSRGGALLFRDIQIRPQHLIDGAPVVDDPTESQRAQSDWRARYPARPVVTDWPATCAIVTRSIASSPLQPRCSRRSGCGKRVGEDVRKLPTAAHPAGSKWRQLHHVQPGLSTTVERVSEHPVRGGATTAPPSPAEQYCVVSTMGDRAWCGPTTISASSPTSSQAAPPNHRSTSSTPGGARTRNQTATAPASRGKHTPDTGAERSPFHEAWRRPLPAWYSR